jgi:membrane-associated phospholipid phosphatase
MTDTTEQPKPLHFWERGAWGRLAPIEQAAIVGSIILACWLVFDPLFVERAIALDPEARRFFANITDIGKSTWILVLSGLALAILIVLRQHGSRQRPRAALAWAANAAGFMFLAVAGSGIVAALTKNIIGRARPKLYDLVGPIEFNVMAFDSDYAAFPSGHATTVFAIASVIALLAPRARLVIFIFAAWIAATRFLTGAHYVSDTIGGALLGTIFTYWLAERFAARRVFFRRLPDGRVTLKPSRLPYFYSRRAEARLRREER